jgi:hypothetical protein
MFPHLLLNGLSDVVRGAGTHATVFALDERGPDCLEFGVFFLVAPDQISNILAIIGELASGNLRLHPLMLLLGKRDRFSHSSHGIILQSSGAKHHGIDAI